LGIVGCKLTAAVHFSPSFCPIAPLWGCKSGKNCPRWGQFSLSTPQVRQAPSLRNLQTLSEATQQLPQPLKDQFPDIPWRSISGFRNILVHNYLGDIDPLTVRQVVTVHLPQLERAVKTLLGRNT
jgi:uncharacterized protein with HEPN domain